MVWWRKTEELDYILNVELHNVSGLKLVQQVHKQPWHKYMNGQEYPKVDTIQHQQTKH